MTLTTIEEREIRGITARLFKGIIWQTVSLVVIVCTFYFNIIGKIEKLYTLRDENEKVWQLKFDQLTSQNRLLQTQIERFSIQNETLQKQFDFITYKLDELKEKQNEIRK